MLSLREFRRPYFLRPEASDLRGFVKQASFDNFFQNRAIMAPHSAKNETNLAQGGVQGVPDNQPNKNKETTQTQKSKIRKHCFFLDISRFLKNRRAQRLGVYCGIKKKKRKGIVIKRLYKI